MKTYMPRVTDPAIKRALEISGAVLITGARATGKTESARKVAASELRLDGADPLAIIAREQPQLALDGKTPRLLDEWQLVPELWNEVRHEVDRRGIPGQFLLSGSAIPDQTPLRHSGAGRFTHVNMRTMSFFESEHSTGKVSMNELLKGNKTQLVESEADHQDVIIRLVVGGWPGWLSLDEEAARERANAYINDIVQHDFSNIAGTTRDPRRFLSLLRALAALVAQPASFEAMRRRIADEEHFTSSSTHLSLLNDLAQRMFLVEDQPAWAPKLRSKAIPMQTPKRHLTDPSLAAALLNAGVERLLLERETLGHIFESQVTHDCRIYSEANAARGVFHFRDTKGRDEIDIIVEGADGNWLAIEVKLSFQAIDEAAQNLIRVTEKMAHPPVGLIVIVPNGTAYTRKDGVQVVPLTTLGP